VRDVFAALAEEAGHAPATEKRHVLPARPTILLAPEDGVAAARGAAADRRRPADVYLPRWFGGVPAAVDFAVTSGVTAAAIAESGADASGPVRGYERTKRRYGGTDAQCRAAGVAFVPFVMEAEGGFGPSALNVLSRLADDAGRLVGTDRDARAAVAKQRLSIAVQTYNAAAMLARAPRPRVAAGPAELDAAAWAAQAAASAASAAVATSLAGGPPAPLQAPPGTPPWPPPPADGPPGVAAAALPPAQPPAGRGRGLAVPSPPRVAAAGAGAAPPHPAARVAPLTRALPVAPLAAPGGGAGFSGPSSGLFVAAGGNGSPLPPPPPLQGGIRDGGLLAC
jgi:hypothetical protein